MAIVMNMRWSEATIEQYKELRDRIGWEHEVPEGAIFHVSWQEEGALRVLDVWESAENFQAFADAKIIPVAKELDIAGEPDVDIQPVITWLSAKDPVPAG